MNNNFTYKTCPTVKFVDQNSKSLTCPRLIIYGKLKKCNSN